MRALDGVYGRFSTVGDKPVHDPDRFAGSSLLEANWTVMREELHAILEHREAQPA
jgi:beta-hydroxylase